MPPARMHPLLARQLRRHLGAGIAPDTPDALDVLAPGAGALLDAVNAAYEEADRERALLEHSLETVSRELAERYERLQHSLSLLRGTLEATTDGILVVDLAGRVTSCNVRFCELWGLGRPDDVVGADGAALLAAVLERVGTTDGSVALGDLLTAPDGELSGLLTVGDGRVLERTSRPQRIDGTIVGRVWCFRDVTHRIALEKRLAHQAYHDDLTGLANRARFHQRLERALARAGAAPENVAVLLLDLDGFKLVNDGLGHAAGDQLLVQVAKRLLGATRGCDTVARLGGDEFGVVLERVRTESDATVVADRVIAALRAPFAVGDAVTTIGTSIGVARGDSLDVAAGAATAALPAIEPVDALLRNADLALYHAKAKGKGRHAVFAREMHAAAVDRLSLEAALRQALERDELRLVYQPIVNLATRVPIGVEALLRWDRGERGVIPPAEFIPLAEETGLILPIGEWVLEVACRQAMRWREARPEAPPLSLTVNVSGRQLRSATFVDHVRETLRATGLPPQQLVLELTESSVVDEPEVAFERLTALKALGVRLAVDDFGTGYSALSYLQRFPIDLLKIDKSFVDHVTRGGSHAALASAIVALGNALSLRTVAEGVEDADQQLAMRAMGCEFGQGYLFARPLPPAAITELLEAESVVGIG